MSPRQRGLLDVDPEFYDSVVVAYLTIGTLTIGTLTIALAAGWLLKHFGPRK